MHPAAPSDLLIRTCAAPAEALGDAPPPRDAPPEPEDEPPSPAGSGGGLRVQLLLETADVDPPMAGWLEGRVQAAMRTAGVSAGTLTLLALNDAAMGELHERWRGDPEPTDVLTFDLRDPEPGDAGSGSGTDGSVEGDIALGVDVAARRATERGHAVREEVLLYAVHGLLHLLGEDDHDAADFARMHAREDAILSAIGVGPRFGRSDGRTDGHEGCKP